MEKSDNGKVLPFTVTFHLATVEQAHNLAQHLHHHGLETYKQEAAIQPESDHYVDHFSFDEEANTFRAFPRDIPAWRRKQIHQDETKDEPF